LSVDAVQLRVIAVCVAELPSSAVGTDGAVVSEQAAVAALSVGRVERFPAASNASTPSVYVVPHPSPVKVNDVEVVFGCPVEPLYGVYPVTPTLSVAAVQLSVIDVVVNALRDNAPGAVGAVVSEHAAVAALSVDRVERFPEVSNASTPSVYVVPQARPVNVKDVDVVSPCDVVPR
jgi:hypothetical protein